MGGRIITCSRFPLRSQPVSLGAASYACPPLEVASYTLPHRHMRCALVTGRYSHALPLATRQVIVLRRLADDLVDVFSQEIPCLHQVLGRPSDLRQVVIS